MCLVFRMVFLFPILRYINKMATDGGGGVVDGTYLERDDFKSDIGPGLKSQPDANLFFR
jgi:hypothetical protein